MHLRSFIAVTALFLASCDNDTSIQRMPQVISQSHTVGDTLFVQNRFPETPNNPIDVIHDMDIGGEGADERIFGWVVRDFDVDESGELFVLENGMRDYARVYWIASSGEVLAAWGQKGSGPGDIGMSSNIVVFPSGLIGLMSERLIRVFTRDGKLVGTHHTVEEDATRVFSYSAINQLFHAERYGATVVYVRRVGGPRDPILNQVALVTNNGKHAVLLAEFVPENAKYGEQSRHTVIPWIPELQFAATQTGLIYWGDPTEFRYSKMDINNGTYMVVELSKDREPLLKSEINSYANWQSSRLGGKRDENYYAWLANRVPYPRFKPHYDKILADKDGSVWIREDTGGTRLQHMPRSREGVEYYLFDKDGMFNGIVVAPSTISKLVGQYCYSITNEEETGAQVISRYRVVDARR